MAIQRPRIVQIVNPAPGGSQYTSQKAAAQFVRRARAVWEAVSTSIRFIDQVQASHMADPESADSAVFCWRRSISGRMTQITGSAVAPSAAGAWGSAHARKCLRRPKENQ